jgi:YHS domain-containing protein
MIRYLFIRILFPLLLFWLLRSLLHSLFAGVRSATKAPTPQPQPPSVPAGGELRKDPVCGTYVSMAGSPSRSVNGQVLYFCSKDCRDKYKVA